MLTALLEELSEIVGGLDPDAIPLCEAPTCGKTSRAGNDSRMPKTLLARQVEDGETWRKAGFKSAADQLALLSGTSINEAKTQIKTSKRVKQLPQDRERDA